VLRDESAVGSRQSPDSLVNADRGRDHGDRRAHLRPSAPISLFFLITACSCAFVKQLNVEILTLTALVGRFLTSGTRALYRHVAESMLSNQVVAPAPVLQREPATSAPGPAGCIWPP
jgi:hypothetical protein